MFPKMFVLKSIWIKGNNSKMIMYSVVNYALWFDKICVSMGFHDNIFFVFKLLYNNTFDKLSTITV